MGTKGVLLALFAVGCSGIAAAQDTAIRGSAGPPGHPGPPGLRAGHANVRVVAKRGGDYTNPLDAVANVAKGDEWCRKPGVDPTTAPCVISIAPGVYELKATLVVPTFVSLVGYGRESTILDAARGVGVAVQLGDPKANEGSNLGIALRDLSVLNRFGDGATSVALATARQTSLEVSEVRAHAAGSSSNIAVQDGENARNRYRWLHADASGGQTSVGFQIAAGGSPMGCTLLGISCGSRKAPFTPPGSLWAVVNESLVVSSEDG